MRLFRYLIVSLVLAAVAPQSTNAEVYWEIQGAGMGFSSKRYKTGFNYMDKKPDGHEAYFHAGFGLGLFIPISQTYPFMIETGLQFRAGSFQYLKKDKGKSITVLGHSLQNYKSVGLDEYYSPADALWSMQVPVKFNYVYNLTEKSSLRFGLGAFFRYSFEDGDCCYTLYVRGEEKGYSGTQKNYEIEQSNRFYHLSQSNFMIGLTPSATYCYRNFSFGMAYEAPLMFFRDMKLDTYPNRFKHAFMFTIGYKFKSKIWKHIGKGLGAAASVLGDVAVAYAEAQSGNQSSYSGNVSTNYSDADSYNDASSTSGHNNKESTYKSVYANHERAAKSAYDTLTNLGAKIKKNEKDVKGYSGSDNTNFIRQNKILREIQGRMRKTRQDAAKDGITIQKSYYEDVTVSR